MCKTVRTVEIATMTVAEKGRGQSLPVRDEISVTLGAHVSTSGYLVELFAVAVLTAVCHPQEVSVCHRRQRRRTSGSTCGPEQHADPGELDVCRQSARIRLKRM